MGDAIGRLWQGLLDLLTPILIPDWGQLINLLPIFLVIGVVGPLLTLLVLGWVVYVLRKPKDRVRYTDPAPVPAQIVSGEAVYPVGEPYCPIDRLVYPPGATTCETCGRDLAVVCPKCGTGRSAFVDRCGTCGLVLKIDRSALPALRPAGPPPGGAAAA